MSCGFLLRMQDTLSRTTSCSTPSGPTPTSIPKYFANIFSRSAKLLGDPPKAPMFIETHAKRGYRFIAPVVDLWRPCFGTGDNAGRPISRSNAAILSEPRAEHAAVERDNKIILITTETGNGQTGIKPALTRAPRHKAKSPPHRDHRNHRRPDHPAKLCPNDQQQPRCNSTNTRPHHDRGTIKLKLVAQCICDIRPTSRRQRRQILKPRVESSGETLGLDRQQIRSL